jgi:hypothetical protein
MKYECFNEWWGDTYFGNIAVYFKALVLWKYFFFMAKQLLVGQGLLIVEALPSHTDTSHSVGLLWTSDQPTQRPLPDNTQHSKETDIHTPGGIRNRNPSKRAAADPRLRPRGHRIARMEILRKITMNLKNIFFPDMTSHYWVIGSRYFVNG